MQTLEEKLGYHFQNIALLENALTHSSYANEHKAAGLESNERLEFLGDSILGFVTADYLYHKFPHKLEGELSRIRAELVCEKNLALVAEKLSLGDYLLLGNGEEQTGGRQRASITSDVVEALIAAAYLDGGFEAARGIIYRHILDRVAESTHSGDYKTILQELIQREKNQVLSYHLTGESGPDHDKTFTVDVQRNGETVGSGTGHSKKAAEQQAAREALRLFGDSTEDIPL